MALSQPEGIADRGNAERLALAAEALVGALSTDPRVQQAYSAWLRAHELDRWITRLRAYQTVESVQAFGAALDRATLDPSGAAAGLTALQRLVREAPGLTTYDTWLPPLLLALFRVSAYSEASGNPTTFTLRVPDTLPLPRGQKPPRAGKEIIRNVRWYYLAHVKHPKETISALARDHRKQAKRYDKSRSAVHEGIAQAKSLLDLVVARWDPTK